MAKEEFYRLGMSGTARSWGMPPILVTALLVLSTPILASHGAREIGTPLTNTEAALSLLFANPPLPLVYFEKGDSRLTLMVDVFSVQEPATADPIFNTVADVSLNGSMFGLGGGVLYERAVSQRWSLFGMALAARLGRGRLEGRANADTVNKINSGATNVPAQIFQNADSEGSLSVGGMLGLNFRVLGKNPDRFALSTFLGSGIFYTSGSGQSTILDKDAAANSTACAESFPGKGYNCVRRSYDGRNTSFTPVVGLQAAIPIKSFTLTPFYMEFLTSPDAESGEFEFDVPMMSPSGTVSKSPYFRGIASRALGLNLTYRPWGLTINLTGSLAARFIAEQAELTPFKILKFQISKSFGQYAR